MQSWIPPFAGLAVAWLAGLAAFILVRRRDAVRNRDSESRASAEAACLAAELREAIAGLREELERQQETWSLVREAPRASLNFRRANQVSRLFRQGESVPGIAANLDMRRNEVALILKTQMFVGQNGNSSQTSNPPAQSFR